MKQLEIVYRKELHYSWLRLNEKASPFSDIVHQITYNGLRGVIILIICKGSRIHCVGPGGGLPYTNNFPLYKPDSLFVRVKK